ncbi:ATP-binding cassette domain-containing protein [Candidatus Dojkabacteria bacterium]|nr:ATP-binding cassette domain-containing protein [Candidatus Dojkabacteria bacterium]
MIKFSNVKKVYKDKIIALEEVNFDITPGEFCFIVGPSGAGKSTIVRLLVRQEMPTQGEILFESIDITKIPRKLISLYRQQLGIVFQDIKLLPSKTVEENINFALEIINTPKEEVNELTKYLLETVKLDNKGDLFPDALSGGEKQRAAIARALANDPKVLIADEPTGNLDPTTANEILDVLQAINNAGTTVMVVTHDKYIVDKMQTRVIHMDGGKIVSDAQGGYDISSLPGNDSTAKPKANDKKSEVTETDDDLKKLKKLMKND